MSPLELIARTVTRPRRRCASTLAVVGLTATLGACGGGSDQRSPGPPGSADNPLRGRVEAGSDDDGGPARPGATSESAANVPGYRDLVSEQIPRPQSRFTPCNLVTKAQAESVIGSPIRTPVEALQGPTCLYRSSSGSVFVSVSLERISLNVLRHQMRDEKKVTVAGHDGICGTLGRQVLYVPVSAGRVLSVAAPCDLARGFAAKATPQLPQ